MHLEHSLTHTHSLKQLDLEEVKFACLNSKPYTLNPKPTASNSWTWKSLSLDIYLCMYEFGRDNDVAK